MRNDRFLAVASHTHRYRELRDLDDLAPRVVDEIEAFFVDYNARRGVDFRPEGRLPAERARALVDAGARRFARGRK